MIGSIHKIGLVMEDLKNNGVTDEQIEAMYNPAKEAGFWK